MATAAVNIKAEPDLEVDVEERLLVLLQENPKGISNDDIKSKIPVPMANCAVVINALLRAKRIKMAKRKDGTLLYCLYNQEAASPTKGMGDTREEKLVYESIKEAGTKGVWIRDIRFKTNLPVQQLNKITKVLESRQLIKAVKSVNASKKKVFMLYDLEPDTSVTGGAWYSQDTKFDDEFARLLSQLSYRCLEEKDQKALESQHSNPMELDRTSHVTAEEVMEYLMGCNVFTVKLKVENVHEVLDALVFEGRAKEIPQVMIGGHPGPKVYCVHRPIVKHSGLAKIPCGVCPVIDQCCDEGDISPATCVYMNNWLDF